MNDLKSKLGVYNNTDIYNNNSNNIDNDIDISSSDSKDNEYECNGTEVLNERLKSKKTSTKNYGYKEKYEFVNIFQNQHYYFEKCFPTLYPYGYGGPSDKNFKISSLSKYIPHVLKRGGGIDGRRFQSDPNFIFLSYNYEMKKRFTSVAFTAQKEDSVIQSEKVINITPDEFKEIIEYLEINPAEQDEIFDSNIVNISENVKSNEYLNLKKIKNIIRRLSPYSVDLPGTPMFMNQERKKLLAMITSQTILSEGSWRYFITHTPKDIYDSKLFDILMKDYLFIKPEIYKNLEDIKGLVDDLSKSQREQMLIKHPCLAARLFRIKQNCIWKYILKGEGDPLGKINEYWIRTEVLKL